VTAICLFATFLISNHRLLIMHQYRRNSQYLTKL